MTESAHLQAEIVVDDPISPEASVAGSGSEATGTGDTGAGGTGGTGSGDSGTGGSPPLPIQVDDPAVKSIPVEIDRSRIREIHRRGIGLVIVLTISMAVLAAWLAFYFKVSNPSAVEVEAFSIALLSPLIALGGSVVGFYFSERDR